MRVRPTLGSLHRKPILRVFQIGQPHKVHLPSVIIIAGPIVHVNHGERKAKVISRVTPFHSCRYSRARPHPALILVAA